MQRNQNLANIGSEFVRQERIHQAVQSKVNGVHLFQGVNSFVVSLDAHERNKFAHGFEVEVESILHDEKTFQVLGLYVQVFAVLAILVFALDNGQMPQILTLIRLFLNFNQQVFELSWLIIIWWQQEIADVILI
jgi:hypothetical protein